MLTSDTAPQSTHSDLLHAATSVPRHPTGIMTGTLTEPGLDDPLMPSSKPGTIRLSWAEGSGWLLGGSVRLRGQACTGARRRYRDRGELGELSGRTACQLGLGRETGQDRRTSRHASVCEVQGRQSMCGAVTMGIRVGRAGGLGPGPFGDVPAA